MAEGWFDSSALGVMPALHGQRAGGERESTPVRVEGGAQPVWLVVGRGAGGLCRI